MKSDSQLTLLLLKLLVGFLVTLAIIIPFVVLWDEPLAWYFELQLDHRIHNLMGTITETANSAIWFGLAVTGFVVSRYIAKRASTTQEAESFLHYARSWAFMIVSMLTAAAVLNAFKLIIGRYRPRYMFNEDLVGFEPFGVALKMASFPSGHAQSIWSAMIALMFLTPRYTPVYAAIAVIVSASRFLTAVHFVSDVVMSAFLSCAVALLVRHWFERNGQPVRLQSAEPRH